MAVIHSSGAFNWNNGNIPGTPQAVADDIVLHYGQTYHVAGWTIVPTGDGTTFTSDATAHGMFVSIDDVHAF